MSAASSAEGGIAPRGCGPATIVARAIENVPAFIEAEEHQLSVDITKEPLLVSGDPVRLAQVIANL